MSTSPSIAPPGVPPSGGTFTGPVTVDGIFTLSTANAGTDTAPVAFNHVLTPTFANGVASQLSDHNRDYIVYFTVGTAGTALTIAIGNTSTPANTIVNAATATAGESFTFRLPAGWFVEWAATTATLATQLAIGC